MKKMELKIEYVNEVNVMAFDDEFYTKLLKDILEMKNTNCLSCCGV